MALQAIPDRLIALTFDDGSKSDLYYVAPLLEQHGFGATFFINSGGGVEGGEQHYLSWEEIRRLHERGFDIGNHGRNHPNFAALSDSEALAEIVEVEEQCEAHGVPRPTIFGYPGGHHDRKTIAILEDRGYLFARRSDYPEYPLIPGGARGRAYDPTEDHPLLIPSALISGPNWELEDVEWAVAQARDGRITILTFHGVPDIHPHCSIAPDFFATSMKHLHEQGCTVVALRDLVNYVDPLRRPQDPYAPIAARFGVMPGDLKCDFADNPLGIDRAAPSLSWTNESSRRGQMQSAYQILAASSEESLARDEGDLWDSGKVASERSVGVIYAGEPLVSGQTCWWKVRCWNRPGNDGRNATSTFYNPEVIELMAREQASSYSEPARFEMGLLELDDWEGEWIGADPEISSPLLRKCFNIDRKTERARLYVCGLGYYELYANGERVGDHVLDPAPTSFGDEGEGFRDRALYVTYDVTDALKIGSNAIGVMLGNGWYSADVTPMSRSVYGEAPILRLQLNVEFADGDRLGIASDESWLVAAGPVTANDILHGETYDARREQGGWSTEDFDDSAWQQAVAVDAAPQLLRAQMLEPAKVVQTLCEPVRVPYADDGFAHNVDIFDFGQLICGWVRIRVSGPRGSRVVLKYAGALHLDHSLDVSTNLYAEQTDIYILSGEAVEVWEPRFALHGFRYVGITRWSAEQKLEGVDGRVVRTATPVSGEFSCSNELINRIHRNVWWTFAASLQGIPQDAPERYEKFGWLGDTGWVAEDYLYNFDTVRFWRKWLDDIVDVQRPDGNIPVVVPIHCGNKAVWRPWPDWKSTYPMLVWYLYDFYGDEAVLVEHYDGIKKLVDYFMTRHEGFVWNEGLGDHMEPDAAGISSFEPQQTPAALTTTAHCYLSCGIVAQIADILGNTKDTESYAVLARNIKSAFNNEFFDETTCQYAGGSQASNAVPLYMGLVPRGKESAVLHNLVEDIAKHDNHLTTGIIGTDALERALPAFGAADVMFDICTQTTQPSWGYQISQGATTVWETWEGKHQHSLNMKMFASTERFFYRDLAGIAPAEPGYRKIAFKPHVAGDLTWAKASVRTVRGNAAVDWRRTDGGLDMKVQVPCNSRAEIAVPKLGMSCATIKESGETVWEGDRYVAGVAGITSATQSDEHITFNAGGGRYRFQLTAES